MVTRIPIWALLLLAPFVLMCAGSIQYTYDSLNRLTRVSYGDGTSIVYTYDSAGNRTSLAISTTGGGTQPTISLNRSSLSFNATFGQGNPPLQTVQINNSGTGTLSWNAGSSANWLIASPSSGMNAATITVSVSIQGLAATTYNGSLTFTANGASNSPLVVPVTLNVAQPGCGATLSTNSISMNAAGGSGTVTVTAPPTCTWTASSDQSWLTITGGSTGTGNGVVSFQVTGNSGFSRTAILSIGGQTFTVNQDGASGFTGVRFVPVPPCRVADTRGETGQSGAFGPPVVAGGSTRTFPIPSSPCGIPATAKAYSLNVTVVPSGPLAYLTTWPTGQLIPLVSTLNSFEGRIVANAAVVPAGTNGSIDVFVTNATHVILDINGYFDSQTLTALSFYPATPCRIADTRNAPGPFGAPSMGTGARRDFLVPASACGLPGAAGAYSLNATVVPPGPLGYLTLWPTGQTQPYVSTLNSFDGSVVANAAIVPSGTNGSVSAYVTNNTELILDSNGYFATQGGSGALAFYPVRPCRVADTRNDPGAFGGPSMSGGETRGFPIPSSSCGIPSNAKAYSLNVTVVPKGPLAYLTLWPTGQSQPLVSTLNSFLGRIVANAAIVPAGTNGSVSVFVTNPTDVILDINGYFAP
ncbi:MAG: hypothetical protein IT165_06245 [Bryobacterales bacterium]|nr:hypothetical protein [Bryobacterales bacterium]